ncbi:MAG: hypothetical protein WCP85_08260 [Mariniphaga sp.]
MIRDTFEIDGQFLLDDRTSATIASAKRGTMIIVAMVVTVCGFLSDQRFLHELVFRFVNAGDCGENQNVN